jgi:hypothetical protein
LNDDLSANANGLVVGAPFDFSGITVIEVSAIYTRFDPVTKEIRIPVERLKYLRSSRCAAPSSNDRSGSATADRVGR